MVLVVFCYEVLVLYWDLRKIYRYELYDILDFNIPIGINGDCYDRYLITN